MGVAYKGGTPSCRAAEVAGSAAASSGAALPSPPPGTASPPKIPAPPPQADRWRSYQYLAASPLSLSLSLSRDLPLLSQKLEPRKRGL